MFFSFLNHLHVIKGWIPLREMEDSRIEAQFLPVVLAPQQRVSAYGSIEISGVIETLLLLDFLADLCR